MSGTHGSPRLLVTIDGDVVSRDVPFLRADDYGVLRGDGVFEALLVIDGRPELLDEHLRRMARSAAMVEVDLPSPERWRVAVDAAVAAWTGDREMVVRLFCTRGPEPTGDVTAFVLADPVNPAIAAQRDGIAVLTAPRGLDPALAERAPWLLMGGKTLSYAVNMASQRWARAHGADDVVWTAAGDLVLEAPTSAVVVARDRRLVSPPTSLGILASVSLQALFANAPEHGWDVAYEPLHVDDLHRADGVWLLSSVRLAARVLSVDGTPLRDAGLDKEIVHVLGMGVPSEG